MSATLAMRGVPAAPAATTRFRNMRIAAVAAYVVLSLLSIYWAVPRGGALNALGARVDVAQTGDGAVLMTLRNDGRRAWTNVEVVVDERYTTSLGTVPAGARIDVRVREMRNRDQFLRPSQMFFWDTQASGNPPQPTAPSSHRPQQVEVVTAQGVVQLPITPAP